MANVVYPKYKEALLTGSADISLTTGTVKACLVDTGVTAYNAAHDFYNDISSAVIGTPVTLAGKSVTDGIFDSTTDPSFTGLTAAPTIEAIVVFIDTGTPATSRLVAFIDTATGLPISAGATQVDVTWDNGANKIFKL
jgi:hypothetical protein